MIKLDLREEDLQDSGKLRDIVSTILKIQFCYNGIWGKDLKLANKQLRYYQNDTFKSKQFNLSKPLCDTATSTFIGRVPDIVSVANQKERDRIDNFALKLKKQDFNTEIYDVALNCSITAHGYLALYHEKGDTFTSFRSLSPIFTNVVYDCSLACKKLFAFTIYEINEKGDNEITRSYVVNIFTKDKIFAFKSQKSSSNTFVTTDYEMFYNIIFNEELNENEKVKTNSMFHGYSDIPVVEFLNNSNGLSDIYSVLDLIDMYSKLQNNRATNVEDLVNYVLMLKNVRVGSEEEQNIMVNNLKDNRILAIEGDDVDAKYLSNPLNQKEIQVLANDIKENIHYISRIPDLSSVDFSQNASDPIIKIKTKPLLDLCKEKEKTFTRPYLEVLKMALDFAKDNDFGEYNKNYKFDLDKVDLVYAHTLPSNDVDATNMLVNLSNAGLCNPNVLLQNIDIIPNVNEYMKGVKEYNEYVDTRKKNNENNKSSNDTNLERQNSTPVSREQLDNMKNATLGASAKITDGNKVE